MLQASALRVRRRELGLTQVGLARKIGVTANTVARWERGELRIGKPELVSLALDRITPPAEVQDDDVDAALRLAEAAERAMFTPMQGQWLQRLDQETPRLRSALRTCVERGDIQRGMWLAGVLWPRWYQTAAMAEGRAWIAEMLAGDRARKTTRARAMALYAAAILAGHQAEPDRAQAFAEESLAMWRKLGEPKRIAMLVNVVAIAKRRLGETADSIALFQEGVAIARRSGERGIEALLLGNLGPSLLDAGRRDEARRTLRDVIALRHEIGDPFGISHSLVHLGYLALEERDPLAAERLFSEARDTSPANPAFGAAAACGLALAACDAGRTKLALRYALESLRLARALGSPLTTADALDALAVIDARQGRSDRAMRFARAADELRAGNEALTHRAAGERDRRLAPARAAAKAPETIDIRAIVAEAEAITPAPQRIAPNLERLTGREREVARLIATGASNREIAASLGIGVRTVESHVERIRRKTDARSRAQLAAMNAGFDGIRFERP